MIEYIVEGRVSLVRHLKTRSLITLRIRTGRKAGELVCRVTGKLASRLKDQLRVGQRIVVRGMMSPPLKPVQADSVMRVSR